MLSINDYIPLVNFLSNFLMSEVVLFDTEKIVYIEKSLHPSRKPGAPLPDMEALFLKNREYEKSDFSVNYRSLGVNRERLRSATLFLKNDKNAIIGMLTINLHVDDLIAARNVINKFINGPVTEKELKQQREAESLEIFKGSVQNLMEMIIQSIPEKSTVPPDRLSQEEKINIIKDLDNRGTFLIKGSVAEVAKVLKTSEATIYRYLNQL